MLCPKCNNDQTIEFSYTCGTFNCPTCSGCWMEYNPLKSYLEERDEIAAKAFRSIWDLQAEKIPNLRCPQDNQPLYVFVHKRVELEFCQQCRGLWFDANELEGFKKLNPIAPQKTKKDHGVDWTDRKTSMHHFFGSF